MNILMPQPWSIVDEVRFIGSANVSSENVAIPSHQRGDLIVIAARNFSVDGLASVPGIPAGWTSFCASQPGASQIASISYSLRCGFRIAQSNADVSGIWSGATNLSVAVYRNALGIGLTHIGTTNNNTTSVNPPALSISRGSWVGVASSTTNNSGSGLTQREAMPFLLDTNVRGAIPTDLPSINIGNRGVLCAFEITHKG